MIKEIIDGEDPAKPYSDQDIVGVAQRKGNRNIETYSGKIQRRHEYPCLHPKDGGIKIGSNCSRTGGFPESNKYIVIKRVIGGEKNGD